ncbi:MutT/Nudix family protein [Geomicrobium sp. JCM 19055]|nr:MutT/Nudix family protein [Geomicrobium sp. JCM 19055]
MKIRNSAKAIIIDDNCVLLTKNEDRDGYFYLFPGGGQEHGETLQQTLIRECREEVGKKVTYESYFIFVSTLENIMNSRLSMGMCIKLSFILRARSLATK